jgi:hypothetical protein
MSNQNTDFIEKAAVLGLAVPAGLMAGKMASSVAEHGYLSKEAKDRAEKKQSIQDKVEDDKRKKETSDGGGGESTARPKAMKKGGMVKSSASKRADGIATKGKTKGKIC